MVFGVSKLVRIEKGIRGEVFSETCLDSTLRYFGKYRKI